MDMEVSMPVGLGFVELLWKTGQMLHYPSERARFLGLWGCGS